MAWFVYLARCADGSLYTGVTTDPGYTALELASDGTIKRVEFRAPRKLAAQPARPAVHAEMAFEAW